MSPLLFLFLVLHVDACLKVNPMNCEEGWDYFDRESGGWCMKVVLKDSQTQADAEAGCQKEKATLTGFQTVVEMFRISAIAAKKLYPVTGRIWVGLKRRPECIDKQLTRDCTRLTSFEWTDKVTTGTDGIAWTCGQPDNAWNYTQHCTLLQVAYDCSINSYMTAALDDAGCASLAEEGYVCGKKALM